VFGIFLAVDYLKQRSMKQLLVLLVAFFTMQVSASAQSDVDAIVQSLKSADVAALTEHFDEFLDLKLLDKDEVKNMGKNQAGLALKAFFSEQGIKGFDKVSDREIGSTMYMTGKLRNSGKGYNITLMLKVKNNKHQIITIRIS
jgi:Domain of unknown function (DUF4783)